MSLGIHEASIGGADFRRQVSAKQHAKVFDVKFQKTSDAGRPRRFPIRGERLLGARMKARINEYLG
jgi:hypothetical protein